MPASPSETKIAVALSGGVDSAVAAALLLHAGYQVFGITMQLLDAQSSVDASRVAESLGISLHQVDLRETFKQLVIDDFVNCYRAGFTPNPCIRCNSLLKFGVLLDKAMELGADFLATGHYARLSKDAEGVTHLHCANDPRKDQSYFLAAVPPGQLAKALFPLGDFSGKEEVRNLATSFSLPVAEKQDSQDVCFIPDGCCGEFLAGYPGTQTSSAQILHINGKRLGTHDGIWRYTVGQRKGLGIAWKEPLYVLRLDAANNAVIVGEQQYLSADGLIGEKVSWILPPQAAEFSASCKIRYRHQAVPCHVAIDANTGITVRFADPQRAVTPGQTVVIYQYDEVLGAALITGQTA